MYHIIASNTNIASKAGFIYNIFSNDPLALYIGQTCGAYGALGRFSQHISETNSNTFLQRVRTVFKYEEISLSNLILGAYKLPDYNCFHHKARDYREAVEYLVQYKFINLAVAEGLKCPVVSRVMHNSYTSVDFVDEISSIIAKAFLLSVSAIMKNHLHPFKKTPSPAGG